MYAKPHPALHGFWRSWRGRSLHLQAGIVNVRVAIYALFPLHKSTYRDMLYDHPLPEHFSLNRGESPSP